VVEDFRVDGIIPLAHVGGELKHGEEVTPQVSCSLKMAFAILEDKSIPYRWQLKEVTNCMILIPPKWTSVSSVPFISVRRL